MIFFIVLFAFAYSKKSYCTPSNTSCWPSTSDISIFSSSLDGSLVIQNFNDSSYRKLIDLQKDILYTQYPSFIVECKSHSDVQKCVSFAVKHNIEISVISTGHDFAGRNSANDSLQINLSLLKKYVINNKESSITVETGLLFGEIYDIVNKTNPNKVLIGGEDGTVGPGGLTLGGGHSPLTPTYGLSSDHTLEYYLVSAQSDIIHVYNTSTHSTINTSIDDLFWSLKGGGGPTFGVLLNLTFKLLDVKQPDTNKYIALLCIYNNYQHPVEKTGFIGDQILNNYFDVINNGLDETWGGYTIFNQHVTILDLLYYGDVSYAKTNSQALTKLYPNKIKNHLCKYSVYDTFFGNDRFYIRHNNRSAVTYAMSELIPKSNLTDEYTDTLFDFFRQAKLNNIFAGCFIVNVGGNNNKIPYGYTAVSNGFRKSYWLHDYGLIWDNNNETLTNTSLNFASIWEPKLRKFGQGMYFNEENPDCNGCNWKQEYWGMANYNRLLQTKQFWDPNQVFWCKHCVGSDL